MTFQRQQRRIFGAHTLSNVIFGGRLGEYKYDMDKTIEVALAKEIL